MATRARKLPSLMSLFSGSFRDLLEMHGSLLALMAIVALPVTLITAFAGDASPLASYMSLATMFMNIALIWSIIERKSGRTPSISQAYYNGTGSVVRFVLGALVLALEFIPFVIGAVIYTKGATGGTLTATTAERLLLLAVWIILSLPTLFWTVRSAFTLFIIVSTTRRPISAILRSNGLVKGHSFAVLGRLIILVLAMLLILSVPSAAVETLKNPLAKQVGAAALQLLATLVFLPFTNMYLYNLYLGLVDAEE